MLMHGKSWSVKDGTKRETYKKVEDYQNFYITFIATFKIKF